MAAAGGGAAAAAPIAGGGESLISRIFGAFSAAISRVGTYLGPARTRIAQEFEQSLRPDFLQHLIDAGSIPPISTLTYNPSASLPEVRAIMGKNAASEDEEAGRDRMVTAYNLAITVAELKRWTGYVGETHATYARVDRKTQILGFINRIETENSIVYTERFLRHFYLYIFATTRARNSRKSIAGAGILRAFSRVNAPGYKDLQLFSVDDMLTIQAIFNDIEDEHPTKGMISAVMGEVPVNGSELFIPDVNYDAAEVLAQNLGGYRNRIYLTLARKQAADSAARVAEEAARVAAPPILGPQAKRANLSSISGFPASPQPVTSIGRDAFRETTGNSHPNANAKLKSYAGMIKKVGEEAIEGSLVGPAAATAVEALGGGVRAVAPSLTIPSLIRKFPGAGELSEEQSVVVSGSGGGKVKPPKKLGTPPDASRSPGMERFAREKAAARAAAHADQLAAVRTGAASSAAGTSTVEKRLVPYNTNMGGGYRKTRRRRHHTHKRRTHRVKASRRRGGKSRKAGRR